MRTPEEKAQGWPWVPAGRGQWRRARRLALQSDQGLVRILSRRGRLLGEFCCHYGPGEERQIAVGDKGLQLLGSDGRKPDSMWNDSQGNFPMSARQRRRWRRSRWYPESAKIKKTVPRTR